MILPHRGAGMLAPIYGILSALLVNVVMYRTLGSSDYYDKHLWPKMSVLVLAGCLCLVTGLLVKRKRASDNSKGQVDAEYLSSRVDTASRLDAAEPRDHLLFIPLQYWSLVYCGAAILYVVLAR